VSDPVRCHAGWQYPERPQAVFWEGQWFSVEAVLKHWRDPFGIYFWVKCEDAHHFELFYNASEDAWQLKSL
jgi:hypothetical protein